MNLHVVFIILFVTHDSTTASLENNVWGIAGVSGRRANLPCFLNPRIHGDNPKLILWYKRGIKLPIYNHDNRLSNYQHNIQNIGELLISRNSANLSLSDITLSDAGVYECRIDFFKSPTHTSFVNLSVIEPPNSVEIIDRVTDHRGNSHLGPFLEGDAVTLTCLARGGSPKPNITWWHGGNLIRGTISSFNKERRKVVRSDIFFRNLGRDWHNKSVTCSAANTRLVKPIAASAKILMNFLPQSVYISYNRPAIENNGVRINCVAAGSWPPARITWVVRGEELNAEKEFVSEDGRKITSSVYLNVTYADNGREVICRAVNPQVPKKALQNSTFLEVHFQPRVKAVLGRSISPHLLKEGDDVYFVCEIDSNPDVDKIYWHHRGKLVKQNITKGILLSRDSLVLQQIHRSMTGKYRCSAFNYLGNSTSPAVYLRLKYKPQCNTSPTTYFIYDTPINVTCAVSSHPATRILHWRWNTGSDVISSDPFRSKVKKIVGGSFMSDKVYAKLTVYPSKTTEDRELACWAENEMGIQEEPCTFAIKVAKTPAPLSSCRLANITDSSLSLTCEHPDMSTIGSIMYTAEVILLNGTLFANLTSSTPYFNVSRLDPGTNYQIKVYVSYGPITSQPVVVSAYTTRILSNVPNRYLPGMSSVSKILVGTLIFLLVIPALSIAIVRYVIRRTKTRRALISTNKIVHLHSMEVDNPDIIPPEEKNAEL